MAALRLVSSMSAWKSIADEWNVAMSCIQAEERTRINQFVHAEDATLSLIGRLLLRFAAVKMLGLDNNVITFNRTDKGKPYLVTECMVQCTV
jgi:phosphopantetheinyl transferase